MVLGKLPVPGRPTIWITVGQGPTALTVGAGGGCLDIFTLICPFSPLSPSLWETARYRLKYCLKGPLNPKQPTNQPTFTDWLTKLSHLFLYKQSSNSPHPHPRHRSSVFKLHTVKRAHPAQFLRDEKTCCDESSQIDIYKHTS